MLFTNITGQQAIKQRLIQTVSDSRISHAQLFLGPEGCGNLGLAIAYAQYINCENKQPGDSCGKCPSCIKYNKLIHPDLHFIFPVATTKKIAKDPTSNLFLSDWRELLLENNCYISLNDWYNKIDIENKQGIINADDCNEIIRTLSYKSYESEYKVMIIWMVEKLFHAAAPKILKILEEPPDKTLFILVSENHDQIIDTILSRTHLVSIPKITKEEMFTALKNKITGKPESELGDIVQAADGNYREVIRMLQQSETCSDNFENFSNWMRLCYQRKIIDIEKFVNEMATSGREKQKHFLSYSLQFVRDCLVMQYGYEEIVRLNKEEQKFVRNFAPYVNAANGYQFSDEFNKAIYHIERNANPSILFMDLSLKISQLLKIKPS
jgi:DNA polymerase-3 subunit delta'